MPYSDNLLHQEIATASGAIVTSRPQYITYTIDNNGTTLTSGNKSFQLSPYTGTIAGWQIMGDVSGSIAIDVWKAAFGTMPTSGNKISASAGPTLASAISATNTTVSGWTTAVTAGDVIVYNVTATPTSVTRVVVQLKVTPA